MALYVERAIRRADPYRQPWHYRADRAAPGAIQKVATEVFIEDLNRRGGLLGRKVGGGSESDDRQSKPDVARSLYEKLITVDKVDLIIGPYGTASILSAMGRRPAANKILSCTTLRGLRARPSHDMQFSTSGGAFDIEDVWPNLVFDAVGSAPKPPKTVAIVTSKFPSLHLPARRGREKWRRSAASPRCCSSSGTSATATSARSPTASRTPSPTSSGSAPAGSTGVLLLDAMKKIDYTPPMHFYLFRRRDRC